MRQRLTSQLRSRTYNPTQTPSASPDIESSCSYSDLKQPSQKSHHLNSLKKSQAQETEENPYSVSTTARSSDNSTCWTLPPLCPTIRNTVPTSQSQVPQAQTQQQVNTQTLLPYAGFIGNTALQKTAPIPASPPAPWPKFFNYSNKPHF